MRTAGSTPIKLVTKAPFCPIGRDWGGGRGVLLVITLTVTLVVKPSSCLDTHVVQAFYDIEVPLWRWRETLCPGLP